MRTSKWLLSGLAAVLPGLPLIATPAQAQMASNALPPMTAPRNAFTLTTISDGRLLAAGSWNGVELATCEIYSPATGAWSATGSLSTRVRHAAVRLPDGKVLIAGGFSNSLGVKTVEIFEPATGSWSLAPPRGRATSSVLLATYPLCVDTALYSANTTIENARLAETLVNVALSDALI